MIANPLLRRATFSELFGLLGLPPIKGTSCPCPFHEDKNPSCSVFIGAKGHEILAVPQPHEAHYLKLDCSKAKADLGWRPRWSLEQALGSIVEWTRVYQQGGDTKQACLKQIEDFSRA